MRRMQKPSDQNDLAVKEDRDRDTSSGDRESKAEEEALLQENSGMGAGIDKGTVLEKCCESKMRTVMATHLNVALYATCFWIQIGVMPYLTKKLGVDPVVFGYLQTTFAVVQLCGGPFYGRFGDLFGGKAALLLAFIASSMAYSLLAIANSIPLLFLSRIPSVGMHSMQGSQMVITDVSLHEERAAALGKLGISYGIGMIIGPFLGGLITSAANEQTAAATAAMGSLLSVFLVLALIPRDTKDIVKKPDEKKVKDDETKEDSSIFNVKKIIRILSLPSVGYLLAIKCICGIPFGIFQSMFSIVAMEYFKLGPRENGFVLSYVGILGIVIQGIGVGLLTKRYKDTLLMNWSIFLVAFAYLILILVNNIYTFCLALIPLVTGGSILQVIITSSITKIVPAHDTGTAIGLSMATHSLIRSISPTIGGYLFTYFGFIIFGITGVLINGPLALYLIFRGKKDL